MSSAEGGPIRVLHVDDDADLAEIVKVHLERVSDHLEVVTEASAQDGLDRLGGSGEIDCVVSDHDMAGMDGLEFLRAVRERHADLPFILFTGKGSEEIASEAISAGVTEYLQKETGTEQFTVLAHRIERAVSQRRAREALEESERMFSTLVENLPGTVYRCRMEPGWPMTFVSEGCEELTGYAPEAVETGEVSWGCDVVHPDDRADVWEDVVTAVEAAESFEVTYRITTREGETRWVWERGSGVYRDGALIFLEGFVADITARVRRADELARERELTDSVLEAIDDAFYVIDPETGRFVRWNESLVEFTGYSDEELEEMTVTDVVADDHVGRVLAAREEARETGSVVVETAVVPKEGEPFPVEFRGSPLYDADGELIGIGGVGRDVTDRVERERELERYRELVENVGDPMYVLDPEGEIRTMNRAMASHLGYDTGELIGETPETIMPAEDVERSTEVLREILRSEDDDAWRAWEMDMIRADGTRVRCETKTTVIYDDDGEFDGSVGVIRDISERTRREQELERYETIVEAVGDPVYALDADGTITFVNDAIEQLTGYASDELVGRNISVLAPEDDVERGREHIEELLADPDRRAVKYEIDLQTKAGEAIPCEVHIALLPPDDRGFRGTAGIVRDIEERKRREDRLGRFASLVSHDLRNPLHVIQAHAELAQEADGTDHVDEIARSAEKMETMIDDLLELARRGETVGEIRTVPLGNVAREAWETVETPGGDLTIENVEPVEADPDRLRALLENLFRNAVEHGSTSPRSHAHEDAVEHGSTSPGSQARQDAVEHGSTSPRSDAREYASKPERETGPRVRVRVAGTPEGFYVADDGDGIPPEEREVVFERGYTTSEDGTGFGLSIVERIARAHGWEVAVAESEWGGTRFEFET